jgi:glycosyltransferase involved in cell wall biosynthesis|tara:strand:- start:3761 stop:5029 length:1269 start_codon:yes stop_codon:yes gene_type:complete
VKKKILLVGPLLTRSGYGEQARFALRSLRSREDLFDIYIKPLSWGQTSWITESDDDRKWVDKAIEKTIGYMQAKGPFDISLQVTIPNEFQSYSHKDIGYTAGIETTQVAPVWTQKCNEMHSVIVVSDHSKNILEAASFHGQDETGNPVSLENTTKFSVVNYPVKSFDSLPDLELELEHDFNFLTVAQFGPRKNLPNTIKWFLQEFENEEVGLVIKSNIAKNCLMDRSTVFDNLKKIINESGVSSDRKCKIYLLHGNMTDEEMHALYVQDKIKAMVAIPHGEGFGLPIFEAAYSGLPIISVGWSGQCDFLYDEDRQMHFYDVAFDINKVPAEAVWKGVLEENSGWAYAREASAKEKMRECYNDITNNVPDSIALSSCDRAQVLSNTRTPESMYTQFIDCIIDKAEIDALASEAQGLLDDLDLL